MRHFIVRTESLPGQARDKHKETLTKRPFSAGPLIGKESAAFKIASSDGLENGILVAIVLNCILMALTYHGEPQWWEDTQFWANQLFTVIFTGEMAVKIVGFTWKQYWVDRWNRFGNFYR